LGFTGWAASAHSGSIIIANVAGTIGLTFMRYSCFRGEGLAARFC
jgi:hypothetical protein